MLSSGWNIDGHRHCVKSRMKARGDAEVVEEELLVDFGTPFTGDSSSSGKKDILSPPNKVAITRCSSSMSFSNLCSLSLSKLDSKGEGCAEDAALNVGVVGSESCSLSAERANILPGEPGGASGGGA